MFVKADGRYISLAAKIVKKGGIIIYPTDTVYGLGCDPFNTIAIHKIQKIKERRNNPLPILAYDLKSIEKITRIDNITKKKIKKIWPGAVTLVLPKRNNLPNSITSGLSSVGVRIPNNRIALRLIKLSGGLLVGTSANISGTSSPITANEANDQIGDKVDLVLDGGPTLLKKESTVISMINNKIEMLRAGAINPNKIIKILKSGD